MARFGVEGFGLGLLDDATAIHHRHRIGIAGHHTKVMGDEDQRRAGLARQLLEQIEDLRLHRDIERGGRLIGHDQFGLAGQRHRDHGALTHAARILMRIGLQTACSIRDADLLEQTARHLEGTRPGLLAVHIDRLGNLHADGECRVERTHRLLEDHRDAIAANLAHLRVRQLEQVLAFEHDFAGHDATRRIGNQPHQRHRGHALARARLADDGQGLASLQREGHIVDRGQFAAFGSETRRQTADIEQGHVQKPIDFFIS